VTVAKLRDSPASWVVSEHYRRFSPTIQQNPVTVFKRLFIKLERLDWGSILDNKSDGHAG